MKTILIILAVLLTIFFLAIKLYKRRLTKWRDEANFRTVRGQVTIKACNRKLDLLNGYGTILRRPSNKTDTR